MRILFTIIGMSTVLERNGPDKVPDDLIHFFRFVCIGIVPCIPDPVDLQPFLLRPSAVIALCRSRTVLLAADQDRGAVDLLLREGEFSRRHREEDRRIAMDALKINIPETHGILEPAGAAVRDYIAGDVTRETVFKDDAGDEACGYAVIGWKSEEHPQYPAAPAVLVTPDTVSLPYGTADKDARTLTAVSVVSPESDLGTLRYYWQRQVENDNWQSMACGIDMNEYTIPEDLDAGEYTYRCLVTNSLNGGRAEGTSDYVPVTIEKAAAKIVTEPRAISLTYNGRPQRLAMSGSAIGGTMLYSLDGERWSTSIPNVTDAGDYTLYYMVQGDENHTDLDGEQIPDGGQIEVSVAKRKLVITAEPKEKFRGEKDPELTYLVEGLASGDKLVGQLSREAGEDVGTYLISSRGIEPAEYCKANYTLICQGDVLRILTSPRDVKTVTVNVRTVNAKAVNAAVAKAGGSSKYVTTIVLGKKVKKISKSAKLQAVRQALSMKNADKAVKTVASFDAKSGKTADAVKELKLEAKKNYLIVVPEKTENILRATNNIANAKVVRPTYLNVFDILNADEIIIVEAALTTINEWLLGKENA